MAITTLQPVLHDPNTDTLVPLPSGDKLRTDNLYIDPTAGNTLQVGTLGGLYVPTPVVSGGQTSSSSASHSAQVIVDADGINSFVSCPAPKIGWAIVTASMQRDFFAGDQVHGQVRFFDPLSPAYSQSFYIGYEQSSTLIDTFSFLWYFPATDSLLSMGYERLGLSTARFNNITMVAINYN